MSGTTRLAGPGIWAAMLAAVLYHPVLADDAPGTLPSGKQTSERAGVEFFEQHIRPVLIERCFECHSSESNPAQGGLRLDRPETARAGGDSGPAIVPGKIEESLILQAIEYEGALYDMPPDGKLPAETIANFRKWIEMGAPDPRNLAADSPKHVSAPGEPAIGGAKPADLWVLRALQRPALPGVTDTAWPAGDIDRFVLS